MLTRKLPLAAFLAATLVAASSHACGPFFPNYLLADRQANLLYLPEGSFALESSRLVQIGRASCRERVYVLV